MANWTGQKIFFGLMAVTMIVVTLVTSLKVNLFHVLPAMLRDPWTVATFIDFYFNILILWSWVIYKERHFGVSLFWLAVFIASGSIGTSTYVLIQFFKLKPGEGLEKVLLP